MSRLASFKGASTPSASPAKQVNAPSSPARVSESTFHRKTRTLLQELRQITQTWDDLVLIDGLRAARSLIDARTDLDNALALIPPEKQPKMPTVGPKVAIMEKRIGELDKILAKLQKQFNKINNVVENLEATLFEAHKTKGWQWVAEEPLWTTWSLEKFVITIPALLTPYHRALAGHEDIVDTLRSHSVTFEISRTCLNTWMDQPWLADDGWTARWEDLCAVEVEKWDAPRG